MSDETTNPRSILHVDMDAFYASVEVLDDPSLRGKALLVGHDGPRGVVSAASYESRKYGCRSAQPMAVAKRLCPHAIVRPVRFHRYRDVSRQVFAIFESFTPAIEPLSVDEAFLDVTGSLKLFGTAVQIAQALRTRIRNETGCTASVGVAPNKFLAKLASDLNKPDGLTIVTAENLHATLDPLPIERIWRIGPRTAERLHSLGIRTIADVRRTEKDILIRRIGDEAERFIRLANGQDDRPVVSDRSAKSIGQEQTFGEDLAEPDAVRDVMLEQSEAVAARLRKAEISAKTVTVKIRFGDFKTVTRSRTLDEATDSTREIWNTAKALFDEWARDFKPVRLIGVSTSQLQSGPQQLGLFQDQAKVRDKRLDSAVDAINRKFGKTAVRRAGADLNHHRRGDGPTDGD